MVYSLSRVGTSLPSGGSVTVRNWVPEVQSPKRLGAIGAARPARATLGPMSFLLRNGRDRISAWLERWGPLLPILMAEFIVMLGFGALLPVLPLFVQEQGIDAATLGVIIAGWPIGKLVFEPFGGWWADRHSRKPQMVIGVAIIGLSSLAMLFLTTAVALFLLRFAAGAAAGMYDSAARGTIVDATDEDERGEAFGFYGAFQMGGFVLGPAIGAFAAAIVGGFAFPFVMTGALGLVAAGMLAVAMPSKPHVIEDERFEHHPEVEPPKADVNFGATTIPHVVPKDEPASAPQAPLRALMNRVLLAAVVIGFGLQLSFGTYEVIWSIYLIDLGASLEWVGFTFVLFGLPSMIVSPIAGRMVDRRGPMRYIVAAALVVIVSGVIYAIATEVLLPSIVVPIEATATAIMATALFTLVAMGSPQGRSSTAQGIYGASGTVALIIASIAAGALWERDATLPFWFFVVGMIVTLILGLLIYCVPGRRASTAPVERVAS
jgi:DHA1 family multidrug resistance protein-like MFS transporter